ncbi:MAG: T9SS type A sorting domain-containing protein [Flavobacteriales bacterium]
MPLRSALVIAALFTIPCAMAQAPVIQWQHSLGGFLNERAYAVQPTADGGSIAAGYTTSDDGDVTGYQGNWDMWLVKLDEDGALEWQKTLGGTMDEVAYAVATTSDGGCILAGYTASTDGDVTGTHAMEDMWVVKVDVWGTIEWQKTLGGSYYERAYGVQQTADGDYLIAGTTSSVDGDVVGAHQLGTHDAWVVKLDPDGNLLWQRALGGTSAEQANAIANTADGGSLVACFAGSNDGDVSGVHGDYDMWVVKLDADGVIQWQHPFGGATTDLPFAIAATPDGGGIVGGQTISNDGDVSDNHGAIDAWVVKFDASGELQWQRALGGIDAERANALVPTVGGGCLVAGYTHSFDGDVSGERGGGDAWLVQLDATGALVWQKPVGGTLMDEAYSAALAADGGLLMAGYAASNDVDVSGGHGNEDLWVVKLAGGSLGLDDVTAPVFTCAPNPAHDRVRISIPEELTDARITLTDAVGRMVVQQRIVGNTCVLDLGAVPRGLYAIELRTPVSTSVQRLVIE